MVTLEPRSVNEPASQVCLMYSTEPTRQLNYDIPNLVFRKNRPVCWWRYKFKINANRADACLPVLCRVLLWLKGRASPEKAEPVACPYPLVIGVKYFERRVCEPAWRSYTRISELSPKALVVKTSRSDTQLGCENFFHTSTTCIINFTDWILKPANEDDVSACCHVHNNCHPYHAVVLDSILIP